MFFFIYSSAYYYSSLLSTFEDNGISCINLGYCNSLGFDVRCMYGTLYVNANNRVYLYQLIEQRDNMNTEEGRQCLRTSQERCKLILFSYNEQYHCINRWVDM